MKTFVEILEEMRTSSAVRSDHWLNANMQNWWCCSWMTLLKWENIQRNDRKVDWDKKLSVSRSSNRINFFLLNINFLLWISHPSIVHVQQQSREKWCKLAFCSNMAQHLKMKKIWQKLSNIESSESEFLRWKKSKIEGKIFYDISMDRRWCRWKLEKRRRCSFTFMMRILFSLQRQTERLRHRWSWKKSELNK